MYTKKRGNWAPLIWTLVAAVLVFILLSRLEYLSTGPSPDPTPTLTPEENEASEREDWLMARHCDWGDIDDNLEDYIKSKVNKSGNVEFGPLFPAADHDTPAEFREKNMEVWKSWSMDGPSGVRIGGLAGAYIMLDDCYYWGPYLGLR